MVRIYDGGICPKCRNGTLRGTIRNSKKFLIRCSNKSCRQGYSVKARVISEDEWAKETELPILPQGVFLGFAKRMVEYIRLLGNENLVARYLIVNLQMPDGTLHKSVPMFQMLWLAKSPDMISAEEQLKTNIEPVRTLGFAAQDPLWIKYNMVEEYTKLVNDEEILIVQQVEGAKV